MIDIPFMTTAYAARLWGVSEATIKRWCSDGTLAAGKPLGGSQWLIPSDTERPPKQKRGLGSTKFIESGKPNPNARKDKNNE